jgi:hypothetical protein
MLLIITAIAAWFHGIGVVLPYIPFPAFVVLIPTLSYWSWDCIPGPEPIPMRANPGWYVQPWLQGATAFSLAAAGLAWQW